MYDNLKNKNMDKGLIGKIRCMLDFIEKYDGLLDEAKRSGDTEWEGNLYALFYRASHDMRECVSRLFGDEPNEVPPTSNEEPF